MSFVLFLRGMLLALTAFAIAIYWLTGSVWTTLVQTLVCAVIIQVGYFVGVLFLVWRSGNVAEDGRRHDAQSDAGKVGSDVFHNHF
ncbi:exopolysaccharide production repressor protein [Aureimonas altamirensis]|uniref:exopolysaccharide production repressor protein n=1 Tax=Aureimonas altamirensis TaxID=370622 RepID=UPI002557AD5F|nr:exopolysaccharide production repressor protein [Aureimonas altamirensis]